MTNGLWSLAARDGGLPPADLRAQIKDPASRSILGDWYEQRGIDARADIEAFARIDAIMARDRELVRPKGDAAIELRQISAERSDLRARLLSELASTRGWIVAKSHFTFDELATGRRREGRRGRDDSAFDEHQLLDHVERFREPRRPFRPAALLTHSYRGEEARPELEAMAHRAGLAVEILPWSWYYPHWCVAALFTRPAAWKQARSRAEIRREFAREVRAERTPERAAKLEALLLEMRQ